MEGNAYFLHNFQIFMNFQRLLPNFPPTPPLPSSPSKHFYSQTSRFNSAFLLLLIDVNFFVLIAKVVECYFLFSINKGHQINHKFSRIYQRFFFFFFFNLCGGIDDLRISILVVVDRFICIEISRNHVSIGDD